MKLLPIAAILLAITTLYPTPSQAAGSSPDSTTTPTLKQAYKGAFLIGTAVDPEVHLTGDDATLINSQFNAISPENCLKWESVHPRPDTYNFGPADKYVEFGVKNHMYILGHTLVWHNQTPKWVFQDDKGSTISRDALLKRMRDHIHAVVGRYKGRITGWDVVNEAVDDSGAMRNTRWLEIIGDDYIAKAFEYAHEADPKAELYYNDYSLENSEKRAVALKIVRDLKAKGIPVTAVGIQCHCKMSWPSLQQEEDCIKDIAALGVKAMITELDVDMLPAATRDQGAEVSLRVASNPKLNPYPDGLPADMQEKVAQRYADLFGVFLKHKSDITRVTFWGVNDGHSWLNDWPVRGRTAYPLLFDRQNHPKPAYEAVMNAAKPATAHAGAPASNNGAE